MPQKPEEWLVFVLAIGFLLGLVALGVLVLRDSIRGRGRWGINLKGLAGAECPECDEPMPAVRVPKNLSQMLWGGWTCSECGCEVDKWGRRVKTESEESR